MKTHLNLGVRDLDRSVWFYRALLNCEPAKQFADYALFITEDPGVELALDRNARVKVAESAHYGLVVDTTEAVETAIARLESAGLQLDIEREETCCYAKQTKAWASDPDGRRWEVYTVLEETKERNGEQPTCCAGADENSACCAA